MSFPMKKRLQFAALAFCALSITIFTQSCQKEQLDANSATDRLDIKNELSKHFTAYKLITLNANDLFNQTNAAGIDAFTLTLDDNVLPQSKITVQKSNQLSNETEYTEIGQGGKTTKHIMDIRSFKTVDKQQKGMFVMSKDYFSGNITLADIQYHIEPALRFVDNAPKETYIVYKETDAIVVPKTCSIEEPYYANAQQQNTLITRAVRNCWKVQLRAEGDYNFFVNKAGSSIDWGLWMMSSTMANASIAYDVINLDLIVVGVTIYGGPPVPNWGYLGSDGNSLLTQMSNHWLPYPHWNRDAVILFTGKDIYTGALDHGTDGIAYMSVICKNLNTSYGIVEWDNEVTKATSHEVGHLLGAQHTKGTTAQMGIMNPCSGCAANYFNASSKDNMNMHLWFNHGCLEWTTCQ